MTAPSAPDASAALLARHVDDGTQLNASLGQPLTRREARAAERHAYPEAKRDLPADFGAGIAPAFGAGIVPARPLTRREVRAAERAAQPDADTQADEATEPAAYVEGPASVVAAPAPVVGPAPIASASSDTAPTPPPPARQPAVRLAPRAHAHAARHVDLQAARRSRRRVAATASAASIGLVSSLIFAVPANALTPHDFVTTDVHGRTAAQILAVSSRVGMREVQRDSSVAAALSGIVASQDGVKSATAATVIAAALQAGGPRQSIVQTALSYLGDPYVLGGSDHTGIDCSGLTMQAYASVGIHLVHLVSAQDAVGTVIAASAAQPGDLVVFDSDEHVGIYLGGGLIIHAPDVGRPVEIEPVSAWDGTPHHFTRILSS